MRQEKDLRIAIDWCEKLEKDESQTKKMRTQAGIEKVKLTHKLKQLIYPRPVEL
jgi:hypothetical protein